MSEAPDRLPVEALAELARSASEDPLPQVFKTVASTISRATGYQSMTLNVFRPQWDDYEVVFVEGSEAARMALMGTSILREAQAEMLSRADVNRQRVYFFKQGNMAPEAFTTVWLPNLPEPQSEDAWHPADMLVTMLIGSDSQPLGFVAVDEPLSGMRPTESDLRLLQLIGGLAEQALRAAQRSADAEAESRLQAKLTALSPVLSACTSAEQLDHVMLDALTDNFGFQRVSFYRRSGDSLLLERASGWEGVEPPPRLDSYPNVKHVPDHDPGRSAILPATSVFGDGSLAALSAYNGRGPLAWSDDCVVLAWRDRDPEFVRAVVLQDPADRLLPTTDRQQAIQLLVDLAASVARGIAHRVQLDRLASYDTLTGVRNRRGLEATITDHSHVALLACDLDNFKQVNDRHGHDRGDRVLAAFGELLRECARSGDIPARLGGEEFCVVLPNTGVEGAIALAERIRTETQVRLASMVPDGVTVSIGIAVGEHRGLEAGELLKTADSALYNAKQRGRNCVVVADDCAPREPEPSV